jgi:NADP-dependent 3-hydroxy acid dehydrogenase YdfG
MKVIVTGASKGIGRGIALALAKEGYIVGALARSEEDLAALHDEIRNLGETCHIAPCDLRDYYATQSAVRELIFKMHGLDVLINNAGLVVRQDVTEISLEDWHAVIETNINGVFYTIRAALDTFMKQGKGHIINVSSISGKVPLPGGSCYAASKFAVTGFSQSIFQELRDHGIKVTTIYPGSVDSASHRHDPESDHAWKVQPEEVGQACIDVIRTRHDCAISEIEIRPLGRPQKG